MFAKKSLGQNFLKSKVALRTMVETATNSQFKSVVLEIGPGKGALTSALLQNGENVLALEKDDRLIPFLLQNFKDEIASRRLQILHTDALTFNPSEIENNFVSGKNFINPNAYRIVANIPYYITGMFFKHYLTHSLQPQSIVVMLQKEVAKRIVAKDSKESLLSLSVKCYGKPRYIMSVQKKYFSPQPKVDSAIIAIENISRDFFQDISETVFFTILKTGFAHKRKQLIGNLETLMPRKKTETIFDKIKISLKARAEDLALEDWKNLTHEIAQI